MIGHMTRSHVTHRHHPVLTSQVQKQLGVQNSLCTGYAVIFQYQSRRNERTVIGVNLTLGAMFIHAYAKETVSALVQIHTPVLIPATCPCRQSTVLTYKL